MPNNICLLAIDPQVDFCEGGALPVTGATADLTRLASMVRTNGHLIDDIQITLDSHYHVHIAHQCFWKNAKNKHPAPFTTISDEDVQSEKWVPTDPKFKEWCKFYTSQLKKNSRYQLMIWPDHCIIGSHGQNIFPEFFKAITDWETRFFAIARRTTKGSNMFTEHFSAVKADVPHPEDAGTNLNGEFVKTLKTYDTILLAGEALSHCVANSLYDIANEFAEDQIKKFVLLEDASSNVYMCEALGQKFVNDMVKRGMRVSKTTTFFK